MPLLPPEDPEELLKWYEATLKYIAGMETCIACVDQETGVERPTRLCAKHRVPWIAAKGALNGWNHRGGLPLD